VSRLAGSLAFSGTGVLTFTGGTEDGLLNEGTVGGMEFAGGIAGVRAFVLSVELYIPASSISFSFTASAYAIA
jgi:hypothetical protein